MQLTIYCRTSDDLIPRHDLFGPRRRERL
jgi:hypothetical protein